MGFARGQKIDVKDLVVEDGYVYANVTSVGADTAGLLPDLMKGIVTGLNFPKSMHWGSLDFHFVRPIRWFVALFDKDVIPFELANVKSGNVSRGHRFLVPAISPSKARQPMKKRARNISSSSTRKSASR